MPVIRAVGPMTAAYPLTPLQEAMFQESTGLRRPWTYVEQIVCDCDQEGADPVAMQQAWEILARRHPALRTGILADRSQQCVNPAARPMFEWLDWRKQDASRQVIALSRFLVSDRNRGIDASGNHPFRVTLIGLGPKRHRLIWTFPHSLLDGNSFAPLLDEAFAIYEDLVAGGSPHQDEQPNVFADHCRALAGLDHDDGIAYFARTLAGWEGSDGLIDHGAQSTRKDSAEHTLSAETTYAIGQLAKRAGVVSSTVVMAAWGLVIARMSGQGETVFGTTLAGRHLIPDCATAPGCFIVTVPIRVRLGTDLTLGELLTRLRGDIVALRPHEQTPLAEIRRQTDVPFGRPLFDTLVMYDTASINQKMNAIDPKWVKRQVTLLEEGNAPITLAVYHDALMQISVEYDPSQVPKGRMLARSLVAALESMVAAAPDTPLAQIGMLDKFTIDAIHELAGTHEKSATPPPCCATTFEAVVAAHPDQIALCHPGLSDLSYDALDRAANRLAHLLQDRGVKPGDVVGICARRSPAFVAAMLACWKAGAAFVPMDPGYPTETLSIIAEDSTARLILTDAAAPPFDVPTLDLATHHDLPDTAPDRSAMDSGRLAYVIFTSGSTGRPKGVMVSHGALAAHRDAVTAAYGLTAADRVLQFASLSFDVALEEIVPTLLAGATLILRTDAMAQSTSEFLEQCTALKTTVVNLPTGFWVALTDAVEAGAVPFPGTVRLVIVGGERVPMPALHRWHDCLPGLPLINGYGPTETTITCTSHTVAFEDLVQPSLPIGRPLSHARAWVLSADGALVPPGTEGELWISGPAVADGYIGAPAQTAARFRPAPFDDTIGRAYATGDRAVWRNEVLHFIGRVDRQIKLRGFRIEPGQIEQVLEALPEVSRAHVELDTAPGASPRLLGWYSAHDRAFAPDPAQVSRQIAGLLPAHMRPQLVAVTDWPQTPGGKLDTGRLPRPPAPVSEPIAPVESSPLTDEVATLFAEILQLDTVHPDSSFFDLGGNSLMLLRLLGRVESQFGLRLNPAAIYADPTPRGMVEALQSQPVETPEILPIQPAGDLPPLYGVHVVGVNGSFFRPLAAALGEDQPVLGLSIGHMSDDLPFGVDAIAAHYVNQIMRYQPDGPLSLMAVSAGSYVALELAQQLQAAGRDVRALILLDAEGPGGRARVGTAGRLRAHASNFLHQRWRYVRKIMNAKREEFQFTAALARLEKARNHQGIAGDKIESLVDFIASNALAISAYVPQPYHRPITIVRAAGDLFDSPEATSTGLGWADVAAAGFDLVESPGDHLGILEPPNVQFLADLIRKVLARDDSASGNHPAAQ